MLKDRAGVDGPTDHEIRIIEQLDGGEPIWTETHPGVSVANGQFSIVLFENADLSVEALQSQDLYVSIVVGDGIVLSPRKRLSPTFRASVATKAIDVVGNINPQSISVNDQLLINNEGEWVGPEMGITDAQAEAIAANTAKVGLTQAQTDAIAANSAKVGITDEQANAILGNTAKVGITQAQADAIAANTVKSGITPSQAEAIELNTAKIGLTGEQIEAITANSAKVGLTEAQSAAIEANTAKIGVV